MICNETQLIKLGIGDTPAHIKRAVFKYTTCGAWVDFNGSGVKVGSIVEGVDYDTDVFELPYPFQAQDFWDALEEVEQQADAIWHNTHGCEDCWPDFNYHAGHTPINLNCKTCLGEGVII